MNFDDYIPYIGILITVISFIGFCVENIWLALTKGYIDNRNMTLPFLLGYGLFVTAFGFAFGTPDNFTFFGLNPDFSLGMSRIMYFTVAFVVICAGEHLLGKLVEKICGIEYWNYERLPLKLSKYTTIPTSIGFALALTFFMSYCCTRIMRLIMNINKNAAASISVVSIAALLIDFIKSFSVMHKERRLNEKWRITLKR